MTDEEEYAIRQKLADKMIKEMLAEIDADTMKRLRNGQQLLQREDGSWDWFYIVNKDGKVVDKDGNLFKEW